MRQRLCCDGGMSHVELSAVVRHCDGLLNPSAFQDWDGAWNGLQVENCGKVTRIAAAVDASLATVRQAVDAGADLLVVHHGLFWSKRLPWTGSNHTLMRLLVERNLAVYSSHLPLDAHPKLGNNVGLCRALGFRSLKPFFYDRGAHLGLRTRTSMQREHLVAALSDILGREPVLLPGGPERCQNIGVVTGGAGAELKRAVDEGVDTFVTGEGPHWTFALAEELGVNVLYGGHYATETFGVKALAAHLSRRFGLPWAFLDHPTGL